MFKYEEMGVSNYKINGFRATELQYSRLPSTKDNSSLENFLDAVYSAMRFATKISCSGEFVSFLKKEGVTVKLIEGPKVLAEVSYRRWSEVKLFYPGSKTVQAHNRGLTNEELAELGILDNLERTLDIYDDYYDFRRQKLFEYCTDSQREKFSRALAA